MSSRDRLLDTIAGCTNHRFEPVYYRDEVRCTICGHTISALLLVKTPDLTGFIRAIGLCPGVEPVQPVRHSWCWDQPDRPHDMICANCRVRVTQAERMDIHEWLNDQGEAAAPVQIARALWPEPCGTRSVDPPLPLPGLAFLR